MTVRQFLICKNDYRNSNFRMISNDSTERQQRARSRQSIDLHSIRLDLDPSSKIFFPIRAGHIAYVLNYLRFQQIWFDCNCSRVEWYKENLFRGRFRSSKNRMTSCFSNFFSRLHGPEEVQKLMIYSNKRKPFAAWYSIFSFFRTSMVNRCPCSYITWWILYWKRKSSASLSVIDDIKFS